MRTGLIISAILVAIPFSVKSEPYTCEDLGYVFEEGGCRDTSSMVRCPMNLERVWCIGGEMCGQYPVKGLACNDGADIEYCNLTENMGQLSKRCKYRSDICNDGWLKGELKRITGSTSECCRDGWDLDPETGICKEHVCSSIRYPYNTDDATYADYAGEIETCRSGNKVYFGYKSCYNMWKRESENSSDAGYYKCLCKRDDYDNGYVFPFDKSTFYTTFNAGKYGDYHMCADAENSYYGYEHCFRGYVMGKTGGKKNATCSGYTACASTFQSRFPHSDGYVMPNILVSALATGKCVYNETCTEENENYEECNYCLSDAVLTPEGIPYIEICTSNGRKYAYKDYCYYSHQSFVGQTDKGYLGSCSGTCEWGSKVCEMYDLVQKGGQPIGIVFAKSGTSYKIIALTPAVVYNGNNNGGWQGAMDMAAAYGPSVCNSGSGCEVGKWRLPEAWEATGSGALVFAGNEFLIPLFRYYATKYGKDYRYAGRSGIWTAAQDGNTAYRVTDWGWGYIDKNTTADVYAHPIVNMEGK